MKHILLYLVLWVFLSCTKSEKFGSLQWGNYSLSSISDISQLKMYTVGGESGNQQFIKDYLERNGQAGEFNFTGSETVTESMKRTMISIVSDTSALVYNYLGKDTLYARIERKSSSELIILPRESYLSQGSNSRCDSLPLKVLAHPPIKECKFLPGGEICTSSPQLPIGLQGGNFYIPMLNFSLYQSNQYSQCGVVHANNWNSLGQEIFQLLKDGDTLVVQSKKVMLSK